MKSKVLVTGANGQLGETIRELFSTNNLGLEFIFAVKEELDITNKVELKRYFNLNNFSYCINCSAYTNVEQSEKTPDLAYKVNAQGVQNLAILCNENDIILIHISTDYVFDGEKTKPYTVLDKTNPINEYGKSKLAGEQFIQSSLSKYFIIRTSWLYSKKYGNNFYKFIVKNAKNGIDLSITTDQIGCPTDAEDLSKYLVELIADKNTNYGIYHFCNSEPMTWYDFAKLILKENKLLGKIDLKATSNYRTVAKRPKYSVLG
ncbi:dTDP-4-dehydrorhamnose reductase [uncultured Algibacter sp.]|uniref:dTDP-4-dehydrorhamnose reductase n=1 Tax=uncultured Algibacter sp. TaxID=298659 RepID=UPI00261D3417|nr:dTDP-4-dehydrorhamnose reductase [uncultured Algibacter sp.]